jgi:mRNA interferase RelE/StbE
VSLIVVFRQTAVGNLARIRSDDNDLFARPGRAIAMLADQPYPEGAVAWGATGICRLYAGEIRILHEVDDDAATICIINVGVIS